MDDPAYLKECGDKAGSYIKDNTGASAKCFKEIFG
jgi:hypothetical protein